MPKTTWISDAAPEEQGSFCDTKSTHHYDNTSGFEATRQANAAEERGEDAVWMDKSVFGPGDESRPNDAIGPDDRYNLLTVEEDSHGVSGPVKHGPGR